MTLAAARYPVSAKYDPPMIAILHVTYSDGSIEDYPFNLSLVYEFPTPCGPGVVTGASGIWVYDENGYTVEFLYTSGGIAN